MKPKSKTTKVNSKPSGLEAVLLNLSNMLEQNTKVLNTIVSRFSGKSPKKAIKGNEVLSKPQREIFNADVVFLDTLKKIGSSSTTREVAIRLTRENPEMQKMWRKNKDQFMQFLYTSASNLAKEGKIKRVPAGKRRYSYSLKEWNKKK